jgi:hypothetical protein
MLPVVVVTLFLVLLVWRWSRREPCDFAGDLRSFDAACVGKETTGGTVFTPLAFEAAMACKDKYGEMKYNNANKVVVGEFVRTWFRENKPDLRVCDRVMHAQYAIELALTPTVFAVQATRYAASSTACGRRGAAAASR